jgi:hypothetical protein
MKRNTYQIHVAVVAQHLRRLKVVFVDLGSARWWSCVRCLKGRAREVTGVK